MRLHYEQLLSPEPIILSHIGSIQKHSLRVITSNYQKYQSYLNFILLNPESYYKMTNQSVYYEGLSVEKKANINIFDLITSDTTVVYLVQEALNFFFLEHVLYNEESKSFFVYDGTKDENDKYIISGAINREVWAEIIDIIKQVNFIHLKENDLSKAKGNKKALGILAKLMKGRAKKESTQHDEPNPDLEIGNVISWVAVTSPNLNIKDIWDITIYQLWDEYERLRIDMYASIQNRSLSIWGDKKGSINIYESCKNPMKQREAQ